MRKVRRGVNGRLELKDAELDCCVSVVRSEGAAKESEIDLLL